MYCLHISFTRIIFELKTAFNRLKFRQKLIGYVIREVCRQKCVQCQQNYWTFSIPLRGFCLWRYRWYMLSQGGGGNCFQISTNFYVFYESFPNTQYITAHLSIVLQPLRPLVLLILPELVLLPPQGHPLISLQHLLRTFLFQQH